MAFHGWVTAEDLAPGDTLGDVVDGTYTPGIPVLDCARDEPGSGVWRVTTPAGSFVLLGDAAVYVFSPKGR